MQTSQNISTTRRAGLSKSVWALILAVCIAAFGLVTLALIGQSTSSYTPEDIAHGVVNPGQQIRLVGKVKKGSVNRDLSPIIAFVMVKNEASIPIVYNGFLPDMFSEGREVIAEGRMQQDGSFIADSLLARHDETYRAKSSEQVK